MSASDESVDCKRRYFGSIRSPLYNVNTGLTHILQRADMWCVEAALACVLHVRFYPLVYKWSEHLASHPLQELQLYQLPVNFGSRLSILNKSVCVITTSYF